MRGNRGGIISTVSMFLGVGLVLAGVWLTYSRRSARYWPLFVAGLVVGSVSTPFYYYYKAKARTTSPYAGAAEEALAHAGQKPIEITPAFPDTEQPKKPN